MLFVWMRELRDRVTKLTWWSMFVLVLVHMTISWLAFSAIAGEDRLCDIHTFLYWYVTTATTVGYGDLSPQTTAGRYVTALWTMPGGIALFAALIGKSTAHVVAFWSTSMKGKHSYAELNNHIVIFGWHGERTEEMVSLLRDDAATASRDIVLCVTAEIENPLPGEVKFVQAENFVSPAVLKRCGLLSATQIIVYEREDERTLATALAVCSQQPPGHVVAHFSNPEMARLLIGQFPRVETTSNMDVEMIVRSAQDPGSSSVVTELLSALAGATQFTARLPKSMATHDFGFWFYHFKQRGQATLIGFFDPEDPLATQLNPALDVMLPSGAGLSYIAQDRIPDATIAGWASAPGARATTTVGPQITSWRNVEGAAHAEKNC